MYKNRSLGWIKHLDFILFDMLCLHFSYVLALLLFNGFVSPYTPQNSNSMITFSLMGVLVIFIAETYKNALKHSFKKDVFITLRQAFLTCIFMLLYSLLMETQSKERLLIICVSSAIYLVTSFIVKTIYKQFISSDKNPKKRRSLIIISNSENVERTVYEMETHNYAQYDILGVCVTDKDMTGQKIHDYRVLASKDSILDYICRKWVDEVLVDIPSNEESQKLIEKLCVMGVVVHINFGLNYIQFSKKQFPEKIGKFVCVTCAMNYASPLKLAVKRAIDICAGLVGSLITVLLCIFIGPFILIKSPGPLFFKQKRVGKNGKYFYMYKFRSMYLDAEERKKELMEKNRVKDGLMFKLDEDPRIIGSSFTKDGKYKKGIGNFIRSTSLDEFPQFFNILKGDMSLIGTRPPTLDEWEKYNLHHRARLASKPGLTGMWQVSGRSDITDFEEIVKLDTQYITDWSLTLDIKILFKTFIAVLFHKGSM